MVKRLSVAQETCGFDPRRPPQLINFGMIWYNKDMTKTLFSLLLAASLVTPAAAQTVTSTTADDLRDRARETKQGFQEEKEEIRGEPKTEAGKIREEFKTETEKIREDFKENKQEKGIELRDALPCEKVEEVREGLLRCVRADQVLEIKQLRGEEKERFEIKREEAKKELEERREEFKSRLENEREDVKERLETTREELKVRLEKVKDEKKVQIVERLSESVNALNEKMTTHFLEVLEKVDKVLENIVSRTDKAETHGLDVSAVRTATTAAHTAIASARTAVETQAGKAYSFDVTTEENLKVDVGEARQALHNDLTAVKEIVRQAHVAVKDAAVVLAQIPRVDDLEVETNEDNSTSTP